MRQDDAGRQDDTPAGLGAERVEREQQQDGLARRRDGREALAGELERVGDAARRRDDEHERATRREQRGGERGDIGGTGPPVASTMTVAQGRGRAGTCSVAASPSRQRRTRTPSATSWRVSVRAAPRPSAVSTRTSTLSARSERSAASCPVLSLAGIQRVPSSCARAAVARQIRSSSSR